MQKLVKFEFARLALRWRSLSSACLHGVSIGDSCCRNSSQSLSASLAILISLFASIGSSGSYIVLPYLNSATPSAALLVSLDSCVLTDIYKLFGTVLSSFVHLVMIAWSSARYRNKVAPTLLNKKRSTVGAQTAHRGRVMLIFGRHKR